ADVRGTPSTLLSLEAALTVTTAAGKEQPLAHALWMFVSDLCAGLTPVLAFAFFPLDRARWGSVALTLALLILLGDGSASSDIVGGEQHDGWHDGRHVGLDAWWDPPAHPACGRDCDAASEAVSLCFVTVGWRLRCGVMWLSRGCRGAPPGHTPRRSAPQRPH